MKLLDLLLLIVSTSLLIDSSVAGISGRSELNNELISLTQNVVHFGLFSQDFVTEGEHAGVALSSYKATAGVSILDLVEHQAAIFTSSEKPIVVVSQSHALNRTTMCLYLTELLHRELPNLNSTWMASLAYTSEECFAVGEDLHLRDVVLRITTIVMVACVPHFALSTCYDGTVDGTWNVRDASDRDVASLEIVILATRELSALVLEVIEGDLSLNATVSEARIVLKPVNASNLAVMTLTLLVGWALHSVEVVDVSVLSMTCSEHVTTVAESDLLACLELEAVILSDIARLHVHHEQFVTDGCQDVETTWVEGNSCCIFTDGSLP